MHEPHHRSLILFFCGCASTSCAFMLLLLSTFFFFFNDTATTEIYTLSLHDALPILVGSCLVLASIRSSRRPSWESSAPRSEEHTSELQSHSDLVCRLLLEKKKKKSTHHRVISRIRVRTSNIPTRY